MPPQTQWLFLALPLYRLLASLNLGMRSIKIRPALLILFLPTLFWGNSSYANTQTANLKNQMQGQTSQYLAMHAKDPVHWQNWNAATLKKAQQSNKPLFISSGYYACHWCHVMQEENYQNLLTAKLINQHFIAVKIDRELNPELDTALVNFSKQITGQGGWPQHAILTPKGVPFAAFIYLPNKDLNNYLERIAKLWENDAKAITQLAEKTQNKSRTQTVSTAQSMPTQAELKTAIFEALSRQKDELSGGLQGTAKFPRAPILNSLLSIDTNENIDEWLITTLDLMQSEHLIDQIHGGFYRYTIDPEWQIPHFEKMTYNSALLAQSYLLAAKKFQRDDYLLTAKNTLQYLRTHLFNSNTGLYQSSQSAIDKNGVEGGDYIFSKQQLKNRLQPEEFEIVHEAWNLSSPPPYEQGWHPKVIAHEKWPSIKQKLSIDTNTIPKDQKSVLSWNGLVLSALSYAAAMTAGEEQEEQINYQQQAKSLANHLLAILLKPNPPRAVGLNGEYLGKANLEDFALVLQGLYDYREQVKSPFFNKQIHQLQQKTLQSFYTESGWQFEKAALIGSISNLDFTKDGSLPSALAVVHCLKRDTPLLSPLTSTELLENPIEYTSFIRQGRSLDCKHP